MFCNRFKGLTRTESLTEMKNNTLHCEALFVNGVADWRSRWNRFPPRFFSFAGLSQPVSCAPSSRWDYCDPFSPPWPLSEILLEKSARAHVFRAGRADWSTKRSASPTRKSLGATQPFKQKATNNIEFIGEECKPRTS